MKTYQAYSKGYRSIYAETPKSAALAFFQSNARARKCSIAEGTHDGECFTVTYGRKSLGEWPQAWNNVTRTTACQLPEH